MKPIPPSPYFRQVIEALVLASPYCLAGRFDDGLNHCAEASVSAARALERRKIKARAIPCAILGVRHGVNFAVGLSARDIYAFVEPGQPFDEWSAGSQFPPEGTLHMHMVVEARFAGNRALIDLTFGQLRGAHGLDVPLSYVAFGEGWPRMEREGWRLAYIDSPHATEINALAEQYQSSKMTGMRDDYHDMISLALHCGNDAARIESEVGRQLPQEYETTRARLQRYMTLGQGPTVA